MLSNISVFSFVEIVQTAVLFWSVTSWNYSWNPILSANHLFHRCLTWECVPLCIWHVEFQHMLYDGMVTGTGHYHCVVHITRQIWGSCPTVYLSDTNGDGLLVLPVEHMQPELTLVVSVLPDQPKKFLGGCQMILQYMQGIYTHSHNKEHSRHSLWENN